jgi:hypothetical protein
MLSFLLCLGYCWFGLVNHNLPDMPEVAMLKRVPWILGDHYVCDEMVRAVNQLRRLGKDKSLAALRDYLAKSREDDKVLVFCRLLFDNPMGWEPPVLGEPLPGIDKKVMKQFPLFPIAVSEGVPFLVIQGYRGGGRSESGAACIRLCEGLSVIKKDYSTSHYEKAARSLSQSESFRKLYEKEGDMREMVKTILRQAKAKAANDRTR